MVDLEQKDGSHFFLERHEKFRFIKHHKFKFSVEKMCKVFKVSTSGYYNWLKAKVSKRWLYNQNLLTHINCIFNDSFKSYGAPRIKTALESLGYYVSILRVARLMRANGLFARRKRKFIKTTDSKHNYPIAPNILNRNLKTTRINQVWISDITYIQTKQGWMYLTVIIDLFNRKVVDWSMSPDLKTENTIISAWHMVIKATTLTQELMFHSDRGSQYASYSFTNVLKSYNGLVIQSNE